MGRVVRKVPATWEHPKNEQGHYIPMHEKFHYNEAEIAEGLHDGWLHGDPPYYNIAVMPDWPESERTHYMMYEDVSEGTPISPAFATLEELAHWLADNGASAGPSMTATYEQWLDTCRRGSACSFVISGGRIVSGIGWKASNVT